ncbi:SDR family oxidoreductase [Sporolactobacillus terrae]|uniref:3-beta hydroxysteroid dehydrogenase n=1 Tax=Sporolactobacillus terrae TaxID=269673 RepID=A0ABX5Q9Y4_9BACL|nr:SDR family oxidoreductase [Sporolactobacillus terrae]QAA23411.1 3-beta hydroxysteroid dehydrogenase [Sporolactobacillus terrae]QAA26381.1 3-beta hydroxysteroid dehydrogenase [Sporolactobacillus terrae]UAK15475.1 SDR family oxidoreductase [Sporolactobacillus terrae]
MRVFVTGATGFIGTAVVRELIEAGHQVIGLARSDKSADTLKVEGAEVHRGSLDDLDSLRSGASAADGVIHLAFKHDFSDYGKAISDDLRAVKAMGEVLEGTGKPFVITSGTLMLTYVLPPGQIGTEKDVVDNSVPRGEAENVVIALAERGVRSSLVRLAPSVHGLGDHGFVSSLIGIARDKGVSAYIGDGYNRWPAVHRLDAARLFRLAVEAAPGGSRLQGVTDEGVPFRDIAGVIGRHLNLPVVSISREEADAHFGWLGAFVSADNPTSSALTQERLGWQPVHPKLIPDLEKGHYFSN